MGFNKGLLFFGVVYVMLYSGVCEIPSKTVPGTITTVNSPDVGKSVSLLESVCILYIHLYMCLQLRQKIDQA